MKEINEISEMEAYGQIISFAQAKNNSPEVSELWEYRSYIDLMKILNGGIEREDKHKEHANLNINANRKLVENAIILILSLFHDLPCDGFNETGKDLDSLNEEEKEVLVNTLKDEFSLLS